MLHSKKFSEILVRNLIFGAEDSIVSTVGMLSGVALAGIARTEILLIGLVLVFVEAFSMAAGSFLSERSTEEFVDGRDLPIRYPLIGGAIMFISYFVSGFIPLFPYLFQRTDAAFKMSVVLSLVALFVLGLVSAGRFNANPLRSGIRTLTIGGIAVVLGVVVGRVFGI
ncbi:MAG TPA: VIT1/CCC1 transporter family protein [Candidatus Paceibacterota bacterium]|nr:VIT1/CCC1 transporter family protein [Candidatus Paceibacterota bacterium]